MLLGWREKHGFHGFGEVAVHRRELELVFEVGHRAQAAHDGFEAVPPGEIHGEPIVAGDRYFGQIAQNLARELDPLIEGEQRGFPRTRRDRDDYPIEQAHAPPHQLLVSAGDRVKSARVHCADFQCGSSPREDQRAL